MKVTKVKACFNLSKREALLVAQIEGALSLPAPLNNFECQWAGNASVIDGWSQRDVPGVRDRNRRVNPLAANDNGNVTVNSLSI